MAEQIITPARRLRTGKVFPRLMGIVCFGLLAYVLVETAIQVVIPPPAHRLVLVQDIPVPSVLPAKFLPFVKNVPQKEDPLAPGVSVRFDHFDFQTLDPLTGLLFIAHTGPAPDKFALINPAFKVDKDSQVDGHVVVFDTRQRKVVGRVDVPQIAGIVAAPDLGRVYAANANDNIVYSIDERTLKATDIPLGDNEGPDAIEYDQADQKVFVSDVGIANPDNIDLKNQNIAVIDIHTNKVTKINLGHLPKLPGESAALVKFGYDVGHNRYDPVLHRLFVTIQQLTNQSGANPPNPPPGTGELVSIDPMSQKVVGRVQLPNTCGIPHGMIIDADQHTAFIACTEVDPDSRLVQNLVRVNVQSMRVIPDPLLTLASKPDIVVLDHPLHIVLVGCAAGVSVFDESGGHLRKLGDYILGKNTHTLAIDEKTQLIYLPLPDAGGRPIIRIARYNPNGA
jgi:DNA-binding beta-propeller fold protein YncE